MIAAHDNPLAALAFNSTGTKIATASEKVTVILEGLILFLFFVFIKSIDTENAVKLLID